MKNQLTIFKYETKIKYDLIEHETIQKNNLNKTTINHKMTFNEK